MERSEIKAKLEEVFRSVFREPDLVISDEMTADDVEAWDSLSHVQMIQETEKAFNIKFKIREIRRLKNVGEFIDLIHKKLN